MQAIQFARKQVRIPFVPDVQEVSQVINTLKQPHQLIVSQLYGAGLRVSEALSLRIQDIDFGTQCLNIRFGKARKA